MYLPGVSQADRATRTEPCREQVVIDSVETLDALLARHPYLREHPCFEKRYQRARLYLEILASLGSSQFKGSIKELSEQFDIPHGTLHGWLVSKNKPILFKTLIAHELSRRKHEARIPPAIHLHRIESSLVYEVFFLLKGSRSASKLASAIGQLHLSALEKIVFSVELRPYNSHGPRWLYQVAKEIRIHQREIEVILNQRLIRKLDKDAAQERFRIGVVNNHLFLWRQDTRTDFSNGSKTWLNLYKRERFHFQSLEVKRRFVDTACYQLQISRCGLSKLIGQITDHPNKIPEENAITDLSIYRTNMEGEVLQFLLDITGKTLTDVASDIADIGTGAVGTGRILDPKFPPLEPLRSKIISIMLSDGHLTSSRHPSYAEGDISRRQRVLEIFSELGDVQTSMTNRGNDTVALGFPVVVGRLLEQWGMPVGDKTILNPELPGYIIRGSHEARCAYLSQLIPEEGCVTVLPEENRVQLSWTRSLVFDAGVKAGSYGFKPLISAEDKEFLRRFAKARIEHFGNPDKSVRIRKMSWAELKRLRLSRNPKVVAAAERLKQCVHDYPCRLLEGEFNVCIGLGIKIVKRPTLISLYEKSGRVSVQWHARTRKTEDAVRWAMLAPPDDKRKRDALVEGLKRHSSLVEKVTAKLQREGLEFRPLREKS